MLLSPGDRCTAVLLAQAPAGRLELCMAVCRVSCKVVGVYTFTPMQWNHVCSSDDLIDVGRSIKCWIPMRVSSPSTAVLKLSTGVSTGVACFPGFGASLHELTSSRVLGYWLSSAGHLYRIRAEAIRRLIHRRTVRHAHIA